MIDNNNVKVQIHHKQPDGNVRIYEYITDELEIAEEPQTNIHVNSNGDTSVTKFLDTKLTFKRDKENDSIIFIEKKDL